MPKVVAALIGMALVIVSSVSAAVPRSLVPSISWADDRHRYGWIANHRTFPCADAHPEAVWAGTVCATDNGGRRTWRTIFRGGNYIFGAVRTSRRTGLVSTGAHGHSEWWTRDGGRHWFETDVMAGDRVFGTVGPLIAGRGNYLYWGRPAGASVNRVTPWPPTAQATCGGQWAWAIGPAETADPSGNHCQGSTVNAGMQSRTAVTVPDAALLLLARAPLGFVAVFGRGPTAPERANVLIGVVHRRGATVEKMLPAMRRAPRGVYRANRIIVAWPLITIRGDWIPPNGTRPSRTLSWRSPNGGRSWQLIAR